MIDLDTDATLNGWKVSVLLEEISMAYTTHHVDIMSGAQKEESFLKLCPNGQIPVIVDRDNDDFAIFESDAIMLYLAKKSGQLMPQDDKGESRVTQWLMFQMAGIGPMMGQSKPPGFRKAGSGSRKRRQQRALTGDEVGATVTCRLSGVTSYAFAPASTNVVRRTRPMRSASPWKNGSPACSDPRSPASSGPPVQLSPTGSGTTPRLAKFCIRYKTRAGQTQG